jgi:hypothetical protein
MVTTKDWNLGRPSRKLSNQVAGPFRILEKVESLYKLDLPSSIKVHSIFASEKLRRASKTEPLTGQIADSQPPIEIDGQEE